MASRYGSKAKQKVARALHEEKRGTLKSGSGKTLTSRKQAIAIGLSEARREGGKVPGRKSSRAARSGSSARGRSSSARKSGARRNGATTRANKRRARTG